MSTKKKRVSVTLPDDLEKTLDRMSYVTRLSQSEIIAGILERVLTESYADNWITATLTDMQARHREVRATSMPPAVRPAPTKQ